MHWNNIKVKSIKYVYLVLGLKRPISSNKTIMNIIPSFDITHLSPFQLQIHH
jgi:hypothetical protein